MSNDGSHKRLPSGGGVFYTAGNYIKLVIRLIKDPRISIWLKLLPFTPLLYFIAPDLVPGPVDDAFLMWMGVYLFVEFCPDEIVEEHRRAIENVVEGEWRDLPKADVIETEFIDSKNGGKKKDSEEIKKD